MVVEIIPPVQPTGMPGIVVGKVDSRVAAVVKLKVERPSLIGRRVYEGKDVMNQVDKPGSNIDRTL